MNINPTERNPVVVADWAELQLVYSQQRSISFEAVRSQIDVVGTLEVEDGEYAGAQQELAEVLAASAVAEIERRIWIAGDAYPFRIDGGQLVFSYTQERHMPYVFCLLVADRDLYRSGDRSAILFEHLVKEALEVYLDGEAVRFGSPRDTMYPGISDAIDQLAGLLKDQKIYVYPVNDTDKDLGLDVVAWKSFSDGYISKIEVFMQCATGEDWPNKRGQCSLREWEGIIWCPNTRERGLAIPYVIPGGRKWERAVPEVLFMDRLRIASLLKDRDLSDSPNNWDSWCQGRIQMGAGRN